MMPPRPKLYFYTQKVGLNGVESWACRNFVSLRIPQICGKGKSGKLIDDLQSIFVGRVCKYESPFWELYRTPGQLGIT
jgi:hypothetical protein